MSKKVLKLAGRRPMLLALIVMATVTLGLLISGWLTPAPLRAQGTGGQNPVTGDEITNCPPVWGSWQADPKNLPTISITFAAPGDQCVQQNIPGINGLVGLLSVGAGSPTTTDGGKFQIDTSGCNNPNNTGTLSITPGKTTWTASGCGANPTSGTGTTATFNQCRPIASDTATFPCGFS
jgi:hypothetical protein